MAKQVATSLYEHHITMNKNTLIKYMLPLVSVSTSFVCAGEPVAVPPAAAAGPKAPPPPFVLGGWLIPTLDIRTRVEIASIDGFDDSSAFTLRGRLGAKTVAWNGFSALLEGEFTEAIGDDYHAGASGASPFDPNNAPINDPESREVNQAIIQYYGFDSVIKLGRQRLIFDNAAFIGNVGWRQNEQTYDGLNIVNNSIDKLTLSYSYFNQVNRIFGSEAVGAQAAFEGDVHLFHGIYTGIADATITGYAYLMDFDAPAVKSSNNTYGAIAQTTKMGLNLYGELAFQTEGASAQPDKSAGYGHFTVGKKFGDAALTLGLETLDQNFATPLSTAHAFNGFADVFVKERLNGGGGLNDIYLTYATPLPFGKIKSATSIHFFGDNDTTFENGWEIDQVLTKKYSDYLSGLIKVGSYYADNSAYKDTLRASVELNFIF